MNCEKIKLLVHDYHYNRILRNGAANAAVNQDIQTSQTVEQHLQHCGSCQDFYQQYNQLETELRAIPKPKAPTNLKQRILADRAARDVQSSQTKPNIKRHTFYPIAIAASVCLVVIGSLLVNLSDDKTSNVQTPVVAANTLPSQDQQSSISAVINKPSKVNFLVNSTRIINDVTFTLSVPPQMALHGYAGQQSLSWNGKLKQGKNLLTVPVMALTEQSGILIMKISHKDSVREYKVAVNVRQNRVMGPIRTSGRLS